MKCYIQISEYTVIYICCLNNVSVSVIISIAKYLHGKGVAEMRKAIVHGLQESIFDFSNRVSDASPADVMDLLLLTQYFDVMKGKVHMNLVMISIYNLPNTIKKKMLMES